MGFKKKLESLLPGIFIFGFTVGTGSVTAMAKAGADYGMSLLWAILLSCVITYFLLQLFGKFTIVSGETALQAIRKHIHPAVGIFFIVTLTAHVCGSVIGVMGIVADVTQEWSKSIVDGGISQITISAIFILVVYLIFWVGKNDAFQKILGVVVAIMSVCFLINFIIMMPPIEEMAKGLIPQVPKSGKEENAFLVIASMVGTTVFSGLFILRTTLVKEAGWTIKDMKTQNRDAAFAGIMMFLVSAAIMAAAAGTLHTQGQTLTKVSEMVSLLAPFGAFGVTIFTLGLIAAGVSSQFPNVTLLPWMLDDYKQRKSNLKRPSYRVIVLLISCLGFIVPVFHAKPITVMITSQAFSAMVLPVTVLCILYLGNKKDLMKDFKFSIITSVLLALIFVFACIMSYMSYMGIFATLKAL